MSHTRSVASPEQPSSDEPARSPLATARVMVCMNPSRSAVSLLRAGATLADSLSATLVAAYVVRPGDVPPGRAVDPQLLHENIVVAESLGAAVVKIQADDVVEGLASLANREGVTHAVFGHRGDVTAILQLGSVIEAFARSSRGIELQVIGFPVTNGVSSEPQR